MLRVLLLVLPGQSRLSYMRSIIMPMQSLLSGVFCVLRDMLELTVPLWLLQIHVKTIFSCYEIE